MNVLGLILPDELVLSIAMMAFSDLPAHVQVLLALVGVLLAIWVAARVIVRCGSAKRQEIRNSRRWFKQWRGQ